MSNVSPHELTVGQVKPWVDAENGHVAGAITGTPTAAGTASTTLAPGTVLTRPIDISDRIAARSSVCCCCVAVGAFGESEPQPATSAAANAAMSERSVERVMLTPPTLDAGR